LKVFNLHCDVGHGFEGWFASAASFDEQSARGLVQCPHCGSASITKGLSAPRLNLSAGSSEEKRPAAMPTRAQMQAAVLKIAREIAARTEDVGERFAEEARRIHYKEVEERGIRGVATREQAAALEEEGIGVLPLPFADLLKGSTH
jgi:hypothetical protein